MSTLRSRTGGALVLAALLVLVSACGGGGEGGEGDQPSVSINLGYVFPDGSVIDQSAERFAQAVSERTDGSVTINLFPGGQLGGDEEMATAMSAGTLDASILSIGSSGFGDRVQLGNLPYLVSSYEEADQLYYSDGFIGEWDRETLRQNNIVGLEAVENGFRGLSNNVREVQRPADVAGLTVRAPSSQIIIDIFANWNSQAVAIPFPELYTALEQGTVDGQENGVTLFYDSNFHEVQEFYTDTRYIYAVAIYSVSQPVWDRLSPEQQEIVQAAAVEASQWQRETARADVEQKLAELGTMIDVYIPTEEDFDAFTESVQPIIDRSQSIFGADVIADLRAAVAEIENA